MVEMTLDTLFELPKAIMEKSKIYDEYSCLLTKEKCASYDCKKLKLELYQYVAYYKELIYLYQLPIDFSASLVVSYDSEKVSPTNRISNPVYNMVEKKDSEQLQRMQWLTDFYFTMLTIASKLTLQEATYFTECIYKKNSEEAICERLRVCRNTLQNIKNSCIVKAYIELSTLKIPKSN